jgi:DinB family protein
MNQAEVLSAKAKAREYFRTRCTEAPAAAIRTRVREACESLATFLQGVAAERVARRPRADQWSVQEIVDHLVETYRPGVDELRCLLARQRPPGDPIPASLRSKAPLLRPWRWLLRQLDDLHADVLALLDAAPEDLDTNTHAPLVMVVNVKDAHGGLMPHEWIEEVDWKAYAIVSWRLHAIDHLKQARATLGALDP